MATEDFLSDWTDVSGVYDYTAEYVDGDTKKDSTRYAYRDMGVGYFSGDFLATFEWEQGGFSNSWSTGTPLLIGTGLGEANAYHNSYDGVWARLDTDDIDLYLYEAYDGSRYTLDSEADVLAENTTYKNELERSGTTLYWRVYTTGDSLLYTLSGTLQAAPDYRYGEVVVTWNTGQTNRVGLHKTSNLEFTVTGGASSNPWNYYAQQ